MILIFYPEPERKKSENVRRSRRIAQLVNKVDALRSSYNYQLSELRDQYYPKISDAVTELERLTR